MFVQRKSGVCVFAQSERGVCVASERGALCYEQERLYFVSVSPTHKFD